jgi:hypothetical protein
MAYMQEVKGFIDGDWNYSKIQGETGKFINF